MTRYRIVYSPEANNDIVELTNVITYDYSAPLTAFRYVQGLKETIELLTKFPKSYPLQTRTSLSRYGQNVRRINYKRMAIIYTVHGNIVYIHRIIPASIITSL